jgi:hypothetical protein
MEFKQSSNTRAQTGEYIGWRWSHSVKMLFSAPPSPPQQDWRYIATCFQINRPSPRLSGIQRPNPKKNMVNGTLYAGVDYNLNLYRLQRRLQHMYHGQSYARVGFKHTPESTLFPSQGLGFGLCFVCIRGATLKLEEAHFFMSRLIRMLLSLSLFISYSFFSLCSLCSPYRMFPCIFRYTV